MRQFILASMFAVLSTLGATEPSNVPARHPHRPLMRALDRLYRITPWLKPRVQRAVVRGLYEAISIYSPDKVTFMNYGYATTEHDADSFPLPQDEESNRLSIQMYNAVLNNTDISDKDVLEVGCGRGGGSDFITQRFNPRSVTGLDLSRKAISFCQRRYHHQALSFQVGNAEQLPFPDESFDVVINVESSHGYPSVERFVAEVERVLRRDGVFLLADFRPEPEVNTLRQDLSRAGFTIVDEEQITKNVVTSLDMRSETNEAFIKQHSPHLLSEALRMREFAALKGSRQYERFASGEEEYWRFKLAKHSHQR